MLHNAWRWHGRPGLIERHLATAERCLEWIDEYGDRDGDGFQEYQTRRRAAREHGLEGCRRALVYPDGTLVKGPKALCELQGYVYDAWRRMAEMFEALGDRRAPSAATQGRRTVPAFNEAFWDEDRVTMPTGSTATRSR